VKEIEEGDFILFIDSDFDFVNRTDKNSFIYTDNRKIMQWASRL